MQTQTIKYYNRINRNPKTSEKTISIPLARGRSCIMDKKSHEDLRGLLPKDMEKTLWTKRDNRFHLAKRGRYVTLQTTVVRGKKYTLYIHHFLMELYWLENNIVPPKGNYSIGFIDGNTFDLRLTNLKVILSTELRPTNSAWQTAYTLNARYIPYMLGNCPDEAMDAAIASASTGSSGV